jgi:putative ABC transport system permease protein
LRWTLNLRLSARALARSWPRTALSASGVAVGIASVVVLIGAGVGAERAVRAALDVLGRNLLVVIAGRTETSALRGASQTRTTLRLEDWDTLASEVPGVLETAPVVERGLELRWRGRTLPGRVAGTTPAFERVRSFPLAAGRFIDDEDVRERRRVAVVGAQVVEELFLGESPLGETLHVRGVPFRIVGVTRKKGIAEGANEDELVIVPLSTAMRRLLDVDFLDRVYVQTVSEQASPGVSAALASVLRQRHALGAGTPADFRIQDQTALLRARDRTSGTLSNVVTGLSALALLLSGVGLLVVSLLSVRERWPEIGLRLAVGGQPRDILLQFFTEALLVSLAGGAAGVGLGAVAIRVGAALSRWPMVLAWQAVVYPLSISVAIAVVFGVWPALRAARLDPIVALSSR